MSLVNPGTSGTNFFVIKGWPNGHASELSVKPKSGASILEGSALVLEDDGSGVPQWALADGASITTESAGRRVAFALDTNTASGFDVRYTNKLPAVQHNFSAVTDQFVGAAFAPGNKLEVGTGANVGKLQLRAAGQMVGEVIEFDSVNSKLTFFRA